MSRATLIPLLLYVATWFSTWWVGRMHIDLGAGGTGRGVTPTDLFWAGLQYAAAVMAILTAHELGHYFQSLRYRIPATLPVFIPMPFNPFGTMGAIIFQRPGVATRRQLFDVAVSGPLAGLVVTIPLCVYGLMQSRIEAFLPTADAVRLGDPLILKWFAAAILGPLGPNEDYILNPVLMAGWVGLFITALNLFPVGQLDGGHLLYCLLGRRANVISRRLFAGVLAIVVLGGLFVDERLWAWSVMVLLVGMTGTGHPPTANDREPLGTVRTVLGWLTLAFLPLGFTPIPFLG
jgi:membrane-associated protease RseP (regulator of RpoE activity)